MVRRERLGPARDAELCPGGPRVRRRRLQLHLSAEGLAGRRQGAVRLAVLLHLQFHVWSCFVELLQSSLLRPWLDPREMEGVCRASRSCSADSPSQIRVAAREGDVLQEVQHRQARAGAPLQRVPCLCPTNGPPLSMDQQLRWFHEPQVLPLAGDLRGRGMRGGADHLAARVVLLHRGAAEARAQRLLGDAAATDQRDSDFRGLWDT
mmetsp:Transcript_142110/g.441913  ORF Transcript_142110/g.441913 Transcript_142110/m.441913 type:complete len:207 (+) Transcript_142110:296-916(+)